MNGWTKDDEEEDDAAAAGVVEASDAAVDAEDEEAEEEEAVGAAAATAAAAAAAADASCEALMSARRCATKRERESLCLSKSDNWQRALAEKIPCWIIIDLRVLHDTESVHGSSLLCDADENDERELADECDNDECESNPEPESESPASSRGARGSRGAGCPLAFARAGASPAAAFGDCAISCCCASRSLAANAVHEGG